MQFDRLANIGERVLDGCSSRLTAFEFSASGVKAVLIFLDQHTGLASHKFSLLPHGGRMADNPGASMKLQRAKFSTFR
jgi:hypothetical protein